MINTSIIKERMNVYSLDGGLVGVVDQLEGGTESIRLTRDVVEQMHHWVGLSWVKKVDRKGVHLNKDADQVSKEWLASPPALVPSGAPIL